MTDDTGTLWFVYRLTIDGETYSYGQVIVPTRKKQQSEALQCFAMLADRQCENPDAQVCLHMGVSASFEKARQASFPSSRELEGQNSRVKECLALHAKVADVQDLCEIHGKRERLLDEMENARQELFAIYSGAKMSSTKLERAGLAMSRLMVSIDFLRISHDKELERALNAYRQNA